MRLPNGFGSITHLAGNRRRAWAVRKTIDGHQKYIAFFSAYNDALSYLADYNKNLVVYMPSIVTFADVYQLDMRERRRRIAPVTAKNYGIAFAKCASIADCPLQSISVADLQAVITRMSLSRKCRLITTVQVLARLVTIRTLSLIPCRHPAVEMLAIGWIERKEVIILGQAETIVIM